jgi:uncharacterized membrane protein YfcA
MIILGYLASVLMGLVLGMIGGGGSILTVPILVYLFAIDPTQATAYSLFIVGLTSLLGGATYFKRGDIDLKTGIIFAVPSFIGVYLTRAYFVPSLPYSIFEIGGLEMTKPLLTMLVFALLMVVASVSMIKRKNGMRTIDLSPAARVVLIIIEGVLVGGVTGFVGAGGGFLIVPALVILIGLPMKLAVGTSLFIIAIKSLLGFMGDLQSGTIIDWNLLAGVSVAGAVGMFIGLALSSKVSDTTLKKGFGFFVLIMGSVILFDQLRSLV